jgi:RNA polymerase subunit RPABC4/transcription elongation factor Spt4
MADTASISPEEAFSALGSELRTEILRVFAEAERDERDALTFKEIYDEVPIDSTSQLSYHLDLLDEIFLYKDDDRYRLTQAGDRIVRAILSGTYSERPSFEPTEVEGLCPSCESTDLEAEYRGKALVVRCPECEIPIVTYDLSPAEAEDRTSEEILRSCDRRIHHEYATALRGTCPVCGGRTAVEIDTDETVESMTHYCIARCESCYRQVFAPLYIRLLYHPAVVAFYWERGVDIQSVPFWVVQKYIREWETDVRDEDSFRATITVRYRGEDGGDGGESIRGDESDHSRDDELKLRLDGALDVEPLAPERQKIDR